MKNSCALKNDPRITKIESDLNNSMPLQIVAEKYQVDEDELRQYAVLYTAVSDPEEGYVSIARKTKLTEARVLEDTMNQYASTLKKLTQRIDISLYETESNPSMLNKYLPKSVTDMYISLGGEIRQTVKTLTEIDAQLHGPKQDNSSGLQALADAINNSRS